MDYRLRVPAGAGSCMMKVYIMVLSMIWLVASIQAFTDSQDVYALNQLFNSLSSTFLAGWTGSGGDPCAENWEGVACAGPNVTLLNLTGLSLTGGLGTALQNLTALIVLDLSNNLLSGGYPMQLPPHVQQFDLSNNQFTGNLPTALSQLSNLANLNISSNLLSGTIPDIFDQLEGLTILDLSNNGFGGSLPPSLASLTSLNTLYLQNNQFSGTVNVLAELPLTDLDISNNSFTGWIPSEFKKFSSSKLAGNSFNTSPAPPPPPPLVSPPTPPTRNGSKTQSAAEKGPSKSTGTRTLGSYFTPGKLVGLAFAALLAIAVAVLIIMFFVSRGHFKDREEKYDAESSWHGALRSTWKGEQKQPYVRAQDLKEELDPVVKGPAVSDELEPAVVEDPPKIVKSPDYTVLKPPPVPFESFNLGKSKGSTPMFSMPATPMVRPKNSIAAQAYTIAELQLATESFSEENLIGQGTLGKVYKAEMPDGKVVAVKKLDYSITRREQEDFSRFLSKLSGLRHKHIVELVGYCVEHGEHLLVYEFMGNGSLQEHLYPNSTSKGSLGWNSRVDIALGVAKALEYLHEKCKPAIVHHNLTSVNILLDDDLAPHLSDCGVGTFFQHEQVSAERLGYSAPEHISSGIYTAEADVYSFGVVMLELLTGRKPLDSTRPRSQQSLVRWAVPQLYDIDALAQMVDPTMAGTYVKKSVSRFADIISQCVQTDAEFRPSMAEVVQSLERLQLPR